MIKRVFSVALLIFALAMPLLAFAQFFGPFDPDPTPLPEPGTLSLITIGVAGLIVARIKGKRNNKK
jgi:hypothetical protein